MIDILLGHAYFLKYDIIERRAAIRHGITIDREAQGDRADACDVDAGRSVIGRQNDRDSRARGADKRPGWSRGRSVRRYT